MGRSFVGATSPCQDECEADSRVGKGRLQSHGFREMPEGAGEVALRGEHAAQIVVRVDEIWLHAYGFVQLLERDADLTVLRQRPPIIVPDRRIGGIDPRGGGE